MWSLFHVAAVSCGRRFKSVKSSWLASPMMPLDTAPPMMPARSHQGQSNPDGHRRTATEAVGRHRRFGYAKWGGGEHFSRTARVDPAEARQMVARLAEAAAVSVAAKGRAYPSGPRQERNAPREEAPVSLSTSFSRAADGGTGPSVGQRFVNDRKPHAKGPAIRPPSASY
jgi:hypothetical protein